MPLSDKSFDQLLSANIAAVICSPSEPVTIRMADPASRIKALGLLRQTGGYARYPQNVFGVSNAQLRLLSDNQIAMEVIRPVPAHEAA
jgi:hypothetical protein